MTDKQAFDEWAIIELFGHQRIAGRVTEFTIAGGSFIRVDVPDAKGEIFLTKYYGTDAIYSITPATEPIVTAVAQTLDVAPIHRYELKQLAETKQKELEYE